MSAFAAGGLAACGAYANRLALMQSRGRLGADSNPQVVNHVGETTYRAAI
jgi:hypothetical protein